MCWPVHRERVRAERQVPGGEPPGPVLLPALLHTQPHARGGLRGPARQLFQQRTVPWPTGIIHDGKPFFGTESREKGSMEE